MKRRKKEKFVNGYVIICDNRIVHREINQDVHDNQLGTVVFFDKEDTSYYIEFRKIENKSKRFLE